jgi:phosphatidylserine/phosphatidylglycerophosphate/cardiolipin synthase-like enzyme
MRRLLLGLIALAAIGCDGANSLRSLNIGESKSLSPSAGGQTGPVRVYFTTPEKPPESSEIAHALVNYIHQANHTIDVAGFEVDNKVITEALVASVKRGVQVRLVTETDYINESGVTALKAVGVPVVDDKREGALMHNKFMVFDHNSVWTGSMNFTENCAYRNNNNGVWIDDERLAENYSTKFGWMFEQHKFGGAPSKTARIPHPTITLRDGTLCENYFSTHDHIAQHVIDKIEQAHARIHFLAFSFTHDGISKAMLARSKAGVEVLGVFEKSQVAGGHSDFERFRSAGGSVHVCLDANPRNMHHKVIVLDDDWVVTGSFNFSTSADKSNDENVVILKNAEINRRFEEEFQKVYGAARKLEQNGAVVQKPR